MLEIQDEIRIAQGTLPELRQWRDMGRQALDDLTGEMDRLSSEVEEKTTLLKQLNKECLITEREVKENQNRIFYIREDLSKINKDADRIQMEVEKREDELTRLRSEKGKTSEGIIKTEKELLEFSGSIAALEMEKKDLAMRLEERREEKQAISDEISRALSETSLNREDIEARMQELNTLFLARIQERNAVSGRLSEFERAEKALQEDINNLEDERDLLEKVKILHAERDAQRAVVEELGKERDQVLSKFEELQAVLDGRQVEFDSLAERTDDLQKAIRSLEKEVAEYDEALTMQAKAQEERDHTSEMIAKDLEALRALFTNRRELQILLLLTDERIRALEGIVLSTG